jgi:hypothetical protein
MGDNGRAAESKKLCKWKSGQYEKDRELLQVIVAEPTHFCTECGRVASKKKWLCEPARLVKDKDE